MNIRRFLAALLLVAGIVPAVGADQPFDVEPAAVKLDGPFARAQLLVRQSGASEADLTQRAVFQSSRPEVATVNAAGQVLGRADGEAEIKVTVSGTIRSVNVRVTGAGSPVRFDDDILPILSKSGCNSAACHASQYGQGEFKLSVFASDAAADHAAIVRPLFGRRVALLRPEQSLVLLKPTGAVSHGGSVRLDRNSVDYQMFHAWIGGGVMPPRGKNAPQITGLKIVPQRRIATAAFTQQLRVLASYEGGVERDVTHWARVDSMDEGVLQVSSTGLANVHGRGQGTAMANFQGKTAIMQVIVPYGPAPDLAGWKEQNFVDRLAAAKFRQLGLAPAPLCDDATFLRRAYLTALGTIPTVAEAKHFLDSTDPDKRRKLVDQLLGLTGDPAQDVHNNTYAAWWGLQWADLLKNRGGDFSKQEMWSLHNWLQASFRDNKRFNIFVRDLITARGSTVSNGPANFYRIFDKPDDRAEAVAQVFLGIRMGCAKCHHHPFEAISQNDYAGMTAFFTRVGVKALSDFGVRHYNSDIVVLAKGDAHHPRTGALVPPAPLHGKVIPDTGKDRRQGIADWLTAADNPYFARNIVNRYWAHCMGRGMVEPVDDMRATNPPSNPELLDALAAEFIRTGYDVKQLLRTIMTSRLYQLDSVAARSADVDGRYYASYRAKRIAAEPLSDAIDAVMEVTPRFRGVPAGTRAIELPDGPYDDPLLVTFGKPKRESVCECERGSEPSLAQALHVLNSEALHAKLINSKGRIARLLASKTSHDAVVEEFYLAALARRPTAEERDACRRLRVDAPDEASFYQDLLWSLCNSKHFLFIR